MGLNNKNMDINGLRQAVKALDKANAIASAKKVQRANFRDVIEGLSYYKSLSDERRAELASDVEIWYSDEAVSQRTADYFDRVFSDSQKAVTDLEDAREVSKKVCLGFAKIFGLSQFSHLPPFQKELLTIMCAVHLGIMPANGGNFNMNKGVFVAGKPQIGKTSVFVYLKSTPYFSYRIVTGSKLMELCNSHGAAAMEEYGSRGKCLVIDEIGWEEVAQHYGTKIDAVAEVIHRRNARGLMTHITSNMPIEALKERYQPHIVARIERMCNVIEVKGADSFK